MDSPFSYAFRKRFVSTAYILTHGIVTACTDIILRIAARSYKSYCVYHQHHLYKYKIKRNKYKN